MAYLPKLKPTVGGGLGGLPARAASAGGSGEIVAVASAGLPAIAKRYTSDTINLGANQLISQQGSTGNWGYPMLFGDTLAYKVTPENRTRYAKLNLDTDEVISSNHLADMSGTVLTYVNRKTSKISEMVSVDSAYLAFYMENTGSTIKVVDINALSSSGTTTGGTSFTSLTIVGMGTSAGTSWLTRDGKIYALVKLDNTSAVAICIIDATTFQRISVVDVGWGTGSVGKGGLSHPINDSDEILITYGHYTSNVTKFGCGALAADDTLIFHSSNIVGSQTVNHVPSMIAVIGGVADGCHFFDVQTALSNWIDFTSAKHINMSVFFNSSNTKVFARTNKSNYPMVNHSNIYMDQGHAKVNQDMGYMYNDQAIDTPYETTISHAFKSVGVISGSFTVDAGGTFGTLTKVVPDISMIVDDQFVNTLYSNAAHTMNAAGYNVAKDRFVVAQRDTNNGSSTWYLFSTCPLVT